MRFTAPLTTACLACLFLALTMAASVCFLASVGLGIEYSEGVTVPAVQPKRNDLDRAGTAALILAISLCGGAALLGVSLTRSLLTGLPIGVRFLLWLAISGFTSWIIAMASLWGHGAPALVDLARVLSHWARE